jgi:hypothetical protein
MSRRMRRLALHPHRPAPGAPLTDRLHGVDHDAGKSTFAVLRIERMA